MKKILLFVFLTSIAFGQTTPPQNPPQTPVQNTPTATPSPQTSPDLQTPAQDTSTQNAKSDATTADTTKQETAKAGDAKTNDVIEDSLLPPFFFENRHIKTGDVLGYSDIPKAKLINPSFYPDYNEGSAGFTFSMPIVFSNGFTITPEVLFGFSTDYLFGGNITIPQFWTHIESFKLGYQDHTVAFGYKDKWGDTMNTWRDKVGYISYTYKNDKITFLQMLDIGENFRTEDDAAYSRNPDHNVAFATEFTYHYFSSPLVNLFIYSEFSYAHNWDKKKGYNGGDAVGFSYKMPIDIYQHTLTIMPYFEYGQGFGTLSEYYLDLGMREIHGVSGDQKIMHTGIVFDLRWYFLRDVFQIASGLFLSGYMAGAISWDKETFKTRIHGAVGAGGGISFGRGITILYNIIYSNDLKLDLMAGFDLKFDL